MAKTSKQPRKRSIPQRMCIACREQEGKRTLVRVVRGASGVEVDPTGKLSGRGAYLHPLRGCWENALETRGLQRALRTALTAEEIARLRAFAEGLPVTVVDDPTTDDTAIDNTAMDDTAIDNTAMDDPVVGKASTDE